MSSGTSSASDYPIFSKSKDFTKGTFNKASDVIKGSAEFTGDTLKKGSDFTSRTFGKGVDFAGDIAKGTADIGKGAITSTGNVVGKTFGKTKEVGSKFLKGDIKGTAVATKDLATESLTDVISEFEKGLNNTFKNTYISTTVKVLIALYAAFAAPKLSKSTAMIFDNLIIKIIVSILIIYLATKDASMAIILALAFILTLQTTNKYKLIETSQSVNKNSGLSWLPSASGSKKSDNSKENFTDQVILEKQPFDYAPVLSSHDATGVDTININPHNKKHEVYPEEARQEVYPEQARQGVYPEQARQGVYPEQARQEVYPEEARQEVYPEQARQEVYPEQARQEVYPEQARQEVYPEQARQEVYPEQARQEIYPQTYHEESFPESQPEIYPKATQIPPNHSKKTRNADSCKPLMYNYDGSNSKNKFQFSNISTNVIPGANQNSCPQSWKSQHCIQGLNQPKGFDQTIYPYNN